MTRRVEILAELESLRQELEHAETRASVGKIACNGSFGKFGSRYSALYSPELLIQVTLTGQLALLMLIEMLEFEECIEVISANTDGLVIKCPADRLDMLDAVVWEWEARTGFETEETRYRALYSRDVNNYLAVKVDGKVKGKGAFAPTTLAKNPQAPICTEAVVRYLVDATPVETTIRGCSDVAQFVVVRQVKGGAIDQGGRYLGKAVRWYYSTDVDGPLRYKVNNYTVAGSEGGRALMTLTDHRPEDIDLERYIQMSKDILKEIGA